MNNSILKEIGFSHYDESTFYPKRVNLRKGKETTIWVEAKSGHGILDIENWTSDSYYDEEYREEFSANSSGQKQETDEHFEIFKNLNRKQFDTFSSVLRKDTKFLEIGPSHGGILNNVLGYGVATCDVVEPNKQDSQYLKNKYPSVKIHNSLLEHADLVKDNYDVAVSFEVLEHTTNPAEFLTKIQQSLKKGGNVVLEVPNHNDVLLSCYKKNIGYKDFYYHKAHIHYFTEQSLKELCEKCGFEGEVTSFLMYPFFNNVFWHHNSGPQANAKLALETPVPTHGMSQAEFKINNFFKKVELEYERLVNSNMVGDCLIYKGTKR